MRVALIASSIAFFIAGCGPAPTRPDEPESFEHKPPPDDPKRNANDFAVEGLMGRISEFAVQSVIETHMAGINNCFKQVGGSYVSGEVQLSFEVGTDGRVKTVFVSQSSLGAFAVEDCLVQTTRFLEFPPPEGGPARFIYPFSWNEPGRRLSQPVEVSWGYATMRKHRDALRQCRTRHTFEGPFHVTLYAGARGRVLSAGFHTNLPPGDRFPACVYETLSTMAFPDPGAAIYKYSILVEDLPDA